jgi:hypothetical protein
MELAKYNMSGRPPKPSKRSVKSDSPPAPESASAPPVEVVKHRRPAKGVSRDDMIRARLSIMIDLLPTDNSKNMDEITLRHNVNIVSRHLTELMNSL